MTGWSKVGTLFKDTPLSVVQVCQLIRAGAKLQGLNQQILCVQVQL